MALVSGTTTKYDVIGLRESLSDIIYNISPTETPFMSSIGRGPKAEGTLEEWQTDSLAAADGTNAHLEGDETSFTTPAATVRVGNYLQISKKSVNVSGTLEAVDKAGRKSEKARLTAKKGAELKRDQETILLRAQAGAAGAAGTARTLASLNAFVKTNTSAGATGADPVYTSGVPGAVRTDGTQRAFTETILKNVLQQGYTEGANFKTLMVGPFNKGVVSATFSGIATRNVDQVNGKPGPAAIVAAADVYVSDFGPIRVLPNRFQRERDAWLIDPEMAEVRYLRPHFTEDLAKTGDASKSHIICEYTLVVKQEAGLGLCADLTTS